MRDAVALLEEIERSRRPLDEVRTRLGPLSRQAVELAQDALRHRAALDWWIAREGAQPDPPGRLAMLRRRGRDLAHPEMPLAVRAGIPPWAEAGLARRFGAALEAEMAALLRPAPVDLRVNALKGTREAALAALAGERLRARPTPLSPVGLRLAPGTDIGAAAALAHGLVEVQDEASQLAALLVAAEPGQFVVDYCAGAGGKTLALAPQMRNRGRLVACDISAARLKRARERLRRAGVHNAECRASDPKWDKRHAAVADRVLVDAPCSGSGTWRRRPDARWRLTPRDLDELTALQTRLLAQGARLVKPGGRLVYAACSLLPEETEALVAGLLRERPEFAPLPVRDLWPDAVGGASPVPGPYLALTPAQHGTDGFFAAVLKRRA